MSISQLPPLNALRAFEATARLGGVGRAAQDLHVTHGAVSRQLKLLEDHLGMALFQRAGRGLRLTAAGTRLQWHAARRSPALKTACVNCGGRRHPRHWCWAVVAAYWRAG